MVKVTFNKLCRKAILPTREAKKFAFYVYAKEDIAFFTTYRVYTGLSASVPSGYKVVLKKLLIPNATLVEDPDIIPDREIAFLIRNIGDELVKIRRGEAIAEFRVEEKIKPIEKWNKILYREEKEYTNNGDIATEILEIQKDIEKLKKKIEEVYHDGIEIHWDYEDNITYGGI